MLEAPDNEAFCRRNRLGIEEVFGSTETGGIASRNRFRGQDHFTPFSTVSWCVQDGCLAISSPYISPNLPLDAEGFFLTADRVEVCADNTFLLKGRADAVTKVGGKRVDLEEVRALIAEQDGVQDCVVTALPDPGGRGHLIGALVQGSTVEPGSIREALAGRLEPYALPRIIKTAARMPLKDNGKYDRDAIRHLLLS
jgi:acyl-coenzyme A synthetase/AMP-(fatty) acid ligase